MNRKPIVNRDAVRTASAGLASLVSRILAEAVALLLIAAPAAAKTLTVLNNLDSGAGSLRDAIKRADRGDTIVFDSSLNGQTITLTSGALAISKGLDIEGPGARLLAISGNNQSRVFDISQDLDKPTVAVTIAGLTIEDGLSSSGTGGGIFNRGSTLTLINDVLSNNIANGKSTPDRSARGGAICNLEGGTLVVSGCEFNGNQVLAAQTGSSFGGAIYVLGYSHRATATVTDSTFTDNLAQGGDGGKASNGLSFAGQGLGGAIMSDVGATLSVNGCTFRGNRAQGGSSIAGKSSNALVGGGRGGALLAAGEASTVLNSQFIENTALGGNDNTGAFEVGSGLGGGLSTVTIPFAVGQRQCLTVSGCTFVDNKAVGGSGNLGGSRTGGGFGGGLSDSGSAFGGGMLLLTVSDCMFIGNQALGSDGGTGQNGGDGLGGGIFNMAGSSSPVSLSDCTVSGNQATGGTGGAGANGGNGLGGGLCNGGTSTLTVTGSTVTDNQATGGQGSPAGDGFGGGFYTGLAAILSLDSYTVQNTVDNQPDDIFGPYSLLP